jgi:hypothetical protein
MAMTGNKVEEEVCVREEGKQESISRSSNEQEFEMRFPSLEARGFKSHLGFGETQGHLDLPASGISKDNLPRLFWIVNWFGSDEIPRFAAIAWTGNHQKELAIIFR